MGSQSVERFGLALASIGTAEVLCTFDHRLAFATGRVLCNDPVSPTTKAALGVLSPRALGMAPCFGWER